MSFANSAGHKTSRREGEEKGTGVIPSLFVFYYFSGFNWGRVILIASLPVIFPSWLGARHPPSMRRIRQLYRTYRSLELVFYFENSS